MTCIICGRLALLNDTASNKRLERTRHEQASLLSCVGEPLKRIYKASQEKKERTPTEGADVVFVLSHSTLTCVSETTARVIAPFI